MLSNEIPSSASTNTSRRRGRAGRLRPFIVVGTLTSVLIAGMQALPHTSEQPTQPTTPTACLPRDPSTLQAMRTLLAERLHSATALSPAAATAENSQYGQSLANTKKAVDDVHSIAEPTMAFASASAFTQRKFGFRLSADLVNEASVNEATSLLINLDGTPTETVRGVVNEVKINVKADYGGAFWDHNNSIDLTPNLTDAFFHESGHARSALTREKLSTQPGVKCLDNEFTNANPPDWVYGSKEAKKKWRSVTDGRPGNAEEDYADVEALILNRRSARIMCRLDGTPLAEKVAIVATDMEATSPGLGAYEIGVLAAYCTADYEASSN